MNSDQQSDAVLPLSVIFTTYNATRWLEKVLWGLYEQDYSRFEIIVADDGSTADTRTVLDRYRAEFAERGVALRHVWQSDQGFRKCRILNKAIVHAQHPYVIFTDGDCILRKDFLSVHAASARPGRYLTGSYYKLPMSTSQVISRDDVRSGRCFDHAWLVTHDLPRKRSRLKLQASAQAARWMNRLTPTQPRLKGANASAWLDDLMRVNGFDERMQWGGLDRELGVRLNNVGVVGRLVKYDAICVHLDHSRGYKDASLVAANRALRVDVARHRITTTPQGIRQLLEGGYLPERCSDPVNSASS